MIKNKLICIILLISILLTFSGCSSKTGIDFNYFIVSLGIDKTENGKLKITVQIPSTSSQSSSGSSDSSQSNESIIYSVEAETIDEAFVILDNYLDRKINLSHCSALIISEELAKEGISTFIKTLSNNTELRHTCEIIISSTSALDIIEKVSNSSSSFSSRLFKYLENCSENTALTVNSTFGDFFQKINNDTIQPIAIYIESDNDIIQTSGIALFKDGTMITHIDSLQTLAHSICTNKIDTSILTMKNPFSEKEFVDINISLYKKTEISVDIINNSPYITLTVYPKGEIKSSGSFFNFTSNDNIKKLETVTNDYLSDIIKDYLYDISKVYNTDVVGFKGIAESTFFTEEDFSKVHWDEVFQDSFFKVVVKTDINSSNLFNKE